MNEKKISKKVREIICQYTDVPEEEIASDSSLRDDLAIFSMNAMTIITDIEREFRIEVADWDLAVSINTVRDLEDLVKKKLEEKRKNAIPSFIRNMRHD